MLQKPLCGNQMYRISLTTQIWIFFYHEWIAWQLEVVSTLDNKNYCHQVLRVTLVPKQPIFDDIKSPCRCRRVRTDPNCERKWRFWRGILHTCAHICKEWRSQEADWLVSKWLSLSLFKENILSFCNLFCKHNIESIVLASISSHRLFSIQESKQREKTPLGTTYVKIYGIMSCDIVYYQTKGKTLVQRTKDFKWLNSLNIKLPCILLPFNIPETFNCTLTG